LTKPNSIAGRFVLAVLVTSLATGTASALAAATHVAARQLLATPRVAHEIYAAPAGSSRREGVLPRRTPITEEPTTLPVLRERGAWLEVRLPGRPNGHTGWIRRRATVETFTEWHVVVTLSRMSVAVYRSGRAIRTFSAVVGKPSTPTPVGEFFVEESVALPAYDPGAPFAFALSARSNVLQEFEGGPGQIALHGIANIGGVPGTAVSHGCVRMTADAVRWLAARIGPGVPVTIRQ
jgi:lipoprotein-anchoring transpeptidase ErfK/SrfK